MSDWQTWRCPACGEPMSIHKDDSDETACTCELTGETYTAGQARRGEKTAPASAAYAGVDIGELLPTAYVAEQLAIDPSRVRRLAAKHKIGRKIGRDWLFTRAEVHELTRLSTGKAGRPKR